MGYGRQSSELVMRVYLLVCHVSRKHISVCSSARKKPVFLVWFARSKFAEKILTVNINLSYSHI